MRTTVIIDDALSNKIKDLASTKRLSEFINQCLREHFEKEEQLKAALLLEKAYARAAKTTEPSDEFDVSDTEDWPEW